LEGAPLQGITVASTEAYQAQFDKLVRLDKTAPIFQANDLEVAAFLLRFILGDDTKDFTQYYLTRDGNLLVRDIKPAEIDTLSFPACFMFLLGLTKKILTQNTGTLLAMKCNIVETL
jgi:hypothetical protein